MYLLMNVNTTLLRAVLESKHYSEASIDDIMNSVYACEAKIEDDDDNLSS